MAVTIYHYPKCKKSRAGLEFLLNNKIEPLIEFYIEKGISKETILELSKALKLKPSEMVRKQEDFYREELKHKDVSEDEWLRILSDNPRLLRRPIILNNEKAVIADPAELANQVLTDI